MKKRLIYALVGSTLLSAPIATYSNWRHVVLTTAALSGALLIGGAFKWSIEAEIHKCQGRTRAEINTFLMEQNPTIVGDLQLCPNEENRNKLIELALARLNYPLIASKAFIKCAIRLLAAPILLPCFLAHDIITELQS